MPCASVTRDQQLFNKFQECVRDGSVDDVVQCLESEGFPYEFVSPTGRRPSHLICERGSLEALKALLRCSADGVDLTVLDNKQGSPLHYAAKSGSAGLVQHLLSLGVPPSGLTVDAIEEGAHDTAFHWAVWSIRMEVAHLLFERDQSLADARDKEGETVLHWACINGRVSIVKKLIREFGVDRNARNSVGSTPLHCAVQQGDRDLVRFLVEDACVTLNVQDMHGDTPLHEAVSFEHSDIIEMLLSRQDVDAVPENNDGQTPLDVAEFLHAQYGIQPMLEAAAEGQEAFDEVVARMKRDSAAQEALAERIAQIRASGH